MMAVLLIFAVIVLLVAGTPGASPRSVPVPVCPTCGPPPTTAISRTLLSLPLMTLWISYERPDNPR
jgi:hypothetical protein